MSVPYHAWTHRPKALGGTDPIEIPLAMPTVRMVREGNFTVVDGAYYGLAQTTGADPSAIGVAESFEFFNDPGDGSGVFDVESSGTGGVLRFVDDAGGLLKLVAYDAGVQFTTSVDTTTVTVSLYLGRGTGGGVYSEEFETLEAVSASNVSSTGPPTVRLTGIAIVTPAATGFRPDISPILLVEGGTPTVTKMWGKFAILSTLSSDNFYTP